MQEFITTLDLDFSYISEEEQVDVLKKVNLKVKKGEFIALLGHNGCGKSTLAKHFNAILLPTGGKVYVDGIDTADENSKLDIRQRVGMVFQNPDNQIVSTIVEEDVAFGPENLGLPREEIRKRVDNALKTVGMYEYRAHAPHKLSGGQKQRIAIAGVIAMEPACIVFDEPTAMLDPSGRDEVLKTIVNLCRNKHIAVILITHYMDEAAMADRVIVMGKGEIIRDASPEEVLGDITFMKEHSLDVPQSALLSHKLKKLRIPLTGTSLNPEQCADSIEKAWRSLNGNN